MRSSYSSHSIYCTGFDTVCVGSPAQLSFVSILDSENPHLTFRFASSGQGARYSQSVLIRPCREQIWHHAFFLPIQSPEVDPFGPC
jgi:hypothetical protein